MTLFFVDTNIFMYAIGEDHSHKEPSQEIVRKILKGELDCAINTEVLQEVLYRYTAIGKPKIGFQLFDTLIITFQRIWPVEKEDLLEARKIQERHQIKTRDALHAATMKRNDVASLYSYDTDFDRIPGIRRV